MAFLRGTQKCAPLFLYKKFEFFVDMHNEMCDLLSFLLIGQLFIGICFWMYL